MRVGIIQAARADDGGRPVRFHKTLLPPITVATLAGLTPEDVQVTLVDDSVQRIDMDEDVDLVTVIARTCEAPRAYRIGEAFRDRGIKTIVGGPHATACPQEAGKYFDTVVVGEFEGVWEGLLEDAASGSLQRVYHAPRRVDLSRPLMPQYERLDPRNYVVPPFARTPLIPIETCRDQPFGNIVSHTEPSPDCRVRIKPIANVLREINGLSPSRLFFIDRDILADCEHAHHLFEALRPLKLRWACRMTPQAAEHLQLIELAAEAGCHEIVVPISCSSNDDPRQNGVGPDTFRECGVLFSKMKDVGIIPQAVMTIGFDDDTVESLQRRMSDVMGWPLNYLYVSVLTPLPGSRLYQSLKSDSRINDTCWAHYSPMQCVYEPANVSAGELVELAMAFHQRFYRVSAIAGRFWRFRGEYIKFFPRTRAVEEMFFQVHCNRAAKRRMHPLSLGLTRDRATP